MSGLTAHPRETDPPPAADSTPGPSMQLPLSNISRLMKASLPSSPSTSTTSPALSSSPQIKISSETKVLMQEIVSEFITFVTCEAQERADGQRRSTLSGDDVLYALQVLGLEEYAKVGKIWLARYRVAQEAATSKGKRHTDTQIE